MIVDNIIEIRIDEGGRLIIKPEKERFDHIYREAAEVHYDSTHLFLYSPRPREWTYFDWYKHIISVVEGGNCKLLLTDNTAWINIPDELKKQITHWSKRDA